MKRLTGKSGAFTGTKNGVGYAGDWRLSDNVVTVTLSDGRTKSTHLGSASLRWILKSLINGIFVTAMVKGTAK